MLAHDLRAARIPRETDSGRYDFHSLRVSFASNLARAGVPLATAKDLMRHFSVELTANVYTKLELHDLDEAVGRLPEIATSDRGKADAAATGTDSRALAHGIDLSGQRMASDGDNDTSTVTSDVIPLAARKLRKSKPLDAFSRDVTVKGAMPKGRLELPPGVLPTSPSSYCGLNVSVCDAQELRSLVPAACGPACGNRPELGRSNDQTGDAKDAAPPAALKPTLEALADALKSLSPADLAKLAELLK
jgi:hypothetical protein